jgi:hypothetical protein
MSRFRAEKFDTLLGAAMKPPGNHLLERLVQSCRNLDGTKPCRFRFMVTLNLKNLNLNWHYSTSHILWHKPTMPSLADAHHIEQLVEYQAG